MSLLSGIKFVRKEERVAIASEPRTGGKEVPLERKENKRKREKHHKPHKSKRDSGGSSRQEYRKNYDSDSGSSVDMSKIAEAEEERERNERKQRSADIHRGGGHSQKEDFAGKDDARDATKKFDPNHFRTLMNTLRKTVEADPVPSNHDESGDDDAHTAPEPTQPATVPSSSIPSAVSSFGQATLAAGSTNQSVAAMLRERLKQSKSHIPVNVTTATLAAAAPPSGSYASNVETDRDVVALRNRLNKSNNGAAGVPMNQGQKKRRSNVLGEQDADVDIHELKSREKAGGEDIDEVFRDNILRLGERYKGTEMGGRGALGNGDRAGMDEEGELDMKMFQRKEQSHTEALQREAQRAMRSQQQLRKTVESCRRCTESRTFQRAAVVSQGENAFLRMKTDPDVLVEGHLELVPVSHVSSILQCDEETQREIERYQSCLRRMFEKQGKGVLFVETAVHFHGRPHAHIDVIPVERGMEDEASMFFKEVRRMLNLCLSCVVMFRLLMCCCGVIGVLFVRRGVGAAQKGHRPHRVPTAEARRAHALSVHGGGVGRSRWQQREGQKVE
jgi:diadenosine tetraphosphate (Ap4A) HIT family hydrolase